MVTDRYSVKPTGIRIVTKLLLGPTTREHREIIGVKTIYLGTKYSSHSGVPPVFYNLSNTRYKLQRRLPDVLPIYQNLVKSDSKGFPRYQKVTKTKLCDTLQGALSTKCQNCSSNPLTPQREHTPINSDHCGLPTAYALSNKADKSRSS